MLLQAIGVGTSAALFGAGCSSTAGLSGTDAGTEKDSAAHHDVGVLGVIAEPRDAGLVAEEASVGLGVSIGIGDAHAGQTNEDAGILQGKVAEDAGEQHDGTILVGTVVNGGGDGGL